MKFIRVFFLIYIFSNLSSCGLVVSAILEVIKSSGEETTSNSDVEFVNSSASLDEEFHSNKLGWIEENTLFDSLKIMDGVYSICNKNNNGNSLITIGSPEKVEFIRNLPEKYLISSKIIEQTSLGKLDVYSGLILQDDFIQYDFFFYKKGRIVVSKFNLASELNDIVYDNVIDSIGMKDSVDFSVYFYDKSFDLTVNGNIVFHDQIGSRNWNFIGLATSRKSVTKFDNLKLFTM